MTNKRLLQGAFCFGLVALVNLAVCRASDGPSTPPHPGASPSPSAAPTPDSSAVPAAAPAPDAAAVVAWMKALRDRDIESLVKTTRLPFTLRDTGESGACKNRVATDVDKLKPALACLLKNDLLHEDLVGWPKFKAKLIDKKDMPSWTKKWIKEVPAGSSTYSVRIQGSGSMQSFILLVTGGGVREVWHATGFDAG